MENDFSLDGRAGRKGSLGWMMGEELGTKPPVRTECLLSSTGVSAVQGKKQTRDHHVNTPGVTSASEKTHETLNLWTDKG